MVRRPASAAALLLLILPGVAGAQPQTTLRASLFFYGDNTEFRNPFREGETLFGTVIRAYGDIEITDRVSLELGAVGNHRYGGDDAFEFVRPMASLVLRSGGSRLVIGSLETTQSWEAVGPDRAGPHGLLPALQRETLAFERPAEAGLQWRHRSARVRHETWINWQQVNTPEHRERFDVGTVSDFAVRAPLWILFQGHFIHQGGQQFASGPVADSYAIAPGFALRGPTKAFGRTSLELFALASRHTPDREREDPSRTGAAVFLRMEALRGGWRGHAILWRGDDFVKEEGDANYLSIRMDGRRWRGVRDYSEAGLAKILRPAPGVALEISARVHRVEPDHFEYSYRVLAIANVGWRLK